MFFVFALISTVSYALHNVYMAWYYRRVDLMVAITTRGFALSLAMVPALWIPGRAGWAEIPSHAMWVLAASACALVGNWAGASSVRHLPMGIAAALNMSLSTIVTALQSAWWFGEFLSSRHLFWMGLIFAGILTLGSTKSPPGMVGGYRVGRGVLFCLLFGVALGTAFTLISTVSRGAHPLAAAFCWEFTIAAFGLLIVGIRRQWLRVPRAQLSRRDVGWILLYGIPGAVGTMCYMLAVAGGPLAVVGAVLSTMMVCTSIFAWLIYGERLFGLQWVLILFVCAALIGLRFADY
jgi:drug/metabolite transporter (DMT)-like permease